MRLLLTADPEIEVPPKTYGGIERIVDVLVRRLRATGHEVGLVAKPGSDCPADACYPWPGAEFVVARRYHEECLGAAPRGAGVPARPDP